MTKLWTKILCRIFILLMLIITYLPLVILILFSFSDNKVLGDWSNLSWSFDLYIRLFNSSKIMTAVRNTFIIALSAAGLSTVIGTFSAIGIFYLKRKPRAVMKMINQIPLVNADIVTAIAIMLLFVKVMGNLDGFPALIISHTVITLPYVILSVMPRLGQLNPNLYEAGLDLGAGPVRTLFTVILPQLIPSMISGAILAFTLSLDDYVITMFNNGSVDTISTLIYNSTKKGIDPAFRALSAILFVLVLTVLIFINFKSSQKNKKSGVSVMIPMAR